MDDLIDNNAELAEAIFKAGFKAFLAPAIDSDWVASIVPEKYAYDELQIYSIVMDHLDAQTSRTDMDKARSCINQFYREWSAEGVVEREKCFQPIMDVLNEEYTSKVTKNGEFDRSDIKVLVPGAGLGRLVFDLCLAGFTVEGNEISYHELMASALVLNHTEQIGQFSIAPFALNCSNHMKRSDQFQTFKVPDVHPGEMLSAHSASKVPPSERMSMATGDFCVLYGQEEYKDTFSAIATVFFIDTAPNLIRYVEAITNCLKSGGLWINLGPLLWHHAGRKDADDHDGGEKSKNERVLDAGIGDPGSFELSNEEVEALVEHMGFEFVKRSIEMQTGYISNPRSMLQNTYRPVFWAARKK